MADGSRSQSVPPNPWWSDKMKREFALQNARPETLPAVPHEDSDLDAPDERVGGVGKGRGGSTLGGRLFVTPCSRRSEGRGATAGKRTEGDLPKDPDSDRPPKQAPRTSGPMPPGQGPSERVEPDGLQRALEAEMVTCDGEDHLHDLQRRQDDGDRRGGKQGGGGGVIPQTPRKRSPTTRKEGPSQGASIQVPPGSPPLFRSRRSLRSL